MVTKVNPNERYVLFNMEKEWLGCFEDFDKAKTKADELEVEDGTILKVVQAWGLEYPEDPEIQTFALPLKNL